MDHHNPTTPFSWNTPGSAYKLNLPNLSFHFNFNFQSACVRLVQRHLADKTLSNKQQIQSIASQMERKNST